MISVDQARQIVVDTFRAKKLAMKTERVPLKDALARVLAQEIVADADVPAFDRSIKDGFAVRSEDVRETPATLTVVGESRAGRARPPKISSGEALQIMTGATMPDGADAVVMVEDTESADSSGRIPSSNSFGACRVLVLKTVASGANVSHRGGEARAGEALASRGRRMRVHEISLSAGTGLPSIEVYEKPRVSVIATGDELVPLERTPGPNQIRDSNGMALWSMAFAAGAAPTLLGIARDDHDDLRNKIVRGFESSACLLLTGGVSAGKYDFVEPVLKELGVEFHFDAIAIRPGKPAVFGSRERQFVFALPGNPVSAIVTFELFVSPLLSLLSGETPKDPVILKAKLENSFHQPLGRRGFLPAQYEIRDGAVFVKTVRWKGSSDLAGLARSNCFLVAPENQAEFAAGSTVQVLLPSS